MKKLAVQMAIEMGTQGHRADITMIKAGRTLAAYDGREEVTADDIKEAARLVLPHRMRREPFEEPGARQDELEQAFNKHNPPDDNTDGQPPEREKTPTETDTTSEQGEKSPGTPPEQVFGAARTGGSSDITTPPERQVRRGDGRRGKAQSDSRSGRYVRSRRPTADSPGDDVALDATLRAAAPHQRDRNSGDGTVTFRKEDVREKVRQKKVRNTTVFVVDSSGSMGARQRMRAVKGAILSLLKDAYQKRDHIGLVAFKGNGAEVLLPPTSSVELAKNRLETLPTGGKTPFSEGLLKGHQVLRGEMARDEKVQPLMIIVSDGRANVSMGRNTEALQEAKHVAEQIQHDGIHSVVIDTEQGAVELGGMKVLSEALGGRYLKLEEVQSEPIIQATRELENTR
jgi:magnesium chelatase subunit D